MKIFAIRDEYEPSQKDLGYLLYYEKSKSFYIELPEKADPWETPLLLSSFAKKGETSINSYWSRLWVQQRIVPPDRQNIGQVLRNNNLKEYDEYALLMLSMGRCAQDDYYLVPVEESQLPKDVLQKFTKRIEDVVPLSDHNLLVFFRDGIVRKCDLTSYFAQHSSFSILQKKLEYFPNVQIQPGGHGIAWDDMLTIPDFILYKMGELIPLSIDDFRCFASQRMVNATEAAEILDCSRQYINELVKKGQLHPVKAYVKNTLFLKSEVLKRNWQ